MGDHGRRAELRKQSRAEAEVDVLFDEERRLDQEFFKKEKYAARVGAFEGANYEAKGFFRSELDCIMFTRTEFFCAVCRRAIGDAIDRYAGEP